MSYDRFARLPRRTDCGVCLHAGRGHGRRARLFSTKTIRLIVPFPPGGDRHLRAHSGTSCPIAETAGRDRQSRRRRRRDRPGRRGEPPPTATRCCSLTSGPIAIDAALRARKPRTTRIRRLRARHAGLVGPDGARRLWWPCPRGPSASSSLRRRRIPAGSPTPRPAWASPAPHHRALQDEGRPVDLDACPLQGHGPRPHRRDGGPGDDHVHHDRLLACPAVHQGRKAQGARGPPDSARSPLIPEVPTMAQLGVADFEIATWYGIVAPPGTPREIVMLLNKEIHAILKTPGDARATPVGRRGRGPDLARGVQPAHQDGGRALGRGREGGRHQGPVIPCKTCPWRKEP